jgi:hypothetical protein
VEFGGERELSGQGPLFSVEGLIDFKPLLI